MNELKAASCFEFEKVLSGKSNKLFYSKAEVDKHIGELKKEIAELKEGTKNLILDNYLKDKEIRHHKYKRCLAMAKWCRLHDEFTQLESERLGLPQRAIFMEYRRKAMWWNKWSERWLKIAEKFKEMK